MTFLNSAILFGLAAASIPVVLHFLNMRKLKKIEFSTLFFLKELQKTKIKRIKFKQWLLLLLRILIVVCIVIAFARPALESATFGSSSAKTTAVIIIDNTFSMSVVSDNGSYFNKAKQTAKSLLNNFQDGDGIAVIPVADLSTNSFSPKSSKDLIKKEIDELQISNVSGTLNEAIVKAGQILYQSKNFNKEIYLLTDLQEERIFNIKNELTNLAEILKGARIYLVDIHDKEAVNLSVDDLVLKNQIFEKNKNISFSAVIKNHSGHAVNNSIASLFINGKRSAQQNISLPAKESVTMNFETTLSESGLIEAFVELEDDDINQDNRRFVCFNVPEKINVLMLTDRVDDSRFVKLALANLNGGTFNITESMSSQLPSINISKYDAVLLIGSDTRSGSDQLLKFIEGGKGLIIMPGSTGSIESVKNLFKNLTLPEPSAFIGKQNSTESAALFGKVDLQNPLFADLFEDKEKTKIESPEIYYYLRINPRSAGKTIISLIDNSAFLSEYKIGNGKVLVFNSTSVLTSSTFPLKSLFAPLINKCLFYVSSGTKEQQNIVAGSSILLNIQDAVKRQINITLPNGGKDFFSTDSIFNKKYLSYSNTGLIGTYKFYSGDVLVDYVSINNDPKESVAEYESVSDFEKYLDQIGFTGSLISLKTDDDLSRMVYQSRFGTELWKYFLIAALLLALLEMFVAKSSKKDLSEIEK